MTEANQRRSLEEAIVDTVREPLIVLDDALRVVVASRSFYRAFAVTPQEVWIITENGPNITRIYTDGRAHAPADERWPTYSGDSVGRWEGDALVFDTLALKGASEGEIAGIVAKARSRRRRR